MNSSICLLLLLSLVISSTLSRTTVVEVHDRKAQDGKWTPIKNLNDPHVQEIAQFALADYNKGLGPEGAKWKLLQVPKGDSQVVDVDGKDYRLICKTVSLVYGWGELFQATVLEKKHTMEGSCSSSSSARENGNEQVNGSNDYVYLSQFNNFSQEARIITCDGHPTVVMITKKTP